MCFLLLITLTLSVWNMFLPLSRIKEFLFTVQDSGRHANSWSSHEELKAFSSLFLKYISRVSAFKDFVKLSNSAVFIFTSKKLKALWGEVCVFVMNTKSGSVLCGSGTHKWMTMTHWCAMMGEANHYLYNHY